LSSNQTNMLILLSFRCISTSLFHRERERTTWQLSHLVENSWLPLGIRAARFLGILRTLFWFKFGLRFKILLFCLLGVLFLMFVWFRDISREGAFQGHHTFVVQASFKWCLIWFLFREVWFFFSVFLGIFSRKNSSLVRRELFLTVQGVNSYPSFSSPLIKYYYSSYKRFDRYPWPSGNFKRS